MKTKCLLVLLMALLTLAAHATTCFGLSLSISERLNNDPDGQHIFTCKIIATHIGSSGWESVAVVDRRFRGQPFDTVYIKTGDLHGNYGRKIYPGEEWIVFSSTKDRLHYGSAGCFNLSIPIKDNYRRDCPGYYTSRFLGLKKLYFSVLAEYEEIAATTYTGRRTIRANGYTIAEGTFINGKADGKWTHYNYRGDTTQLLRRSEIEYSNGRLHGEYITFSHRNGKEKISNHNRYLYDLPLELTFLSEQRILYEYQSDWDRTMTRIRLDSNGVVLQRFPTRELNYDRGNEVVRFDDGLYINRLAHDSASYSPLAEGRYERGARVGEWKFYNKSGALVRTEHYPELEATDSLMLIYDAERNIRTKGHFKQGKRLGVWTYFDDGKPTLEWVYNHKGLLTSTTRYHQRGGSTVTPSFQGKAHGKQITWSDKGHLTNSATYQNGNKIMTTRYADDGSIIEQIKFVRSRAFTVVRDTSRLGFDNGLANGYYRQYDHPSGRLIREGTYWNGYKIGVWIKYSSREPGAYCKVYYPETPGVLMRHCGEFQPRRRGCFDQDHRLKSSGRN